MTSLAATEFAEPLLLGLMSSLLASNGRVTQFPQQALAMKLTLPAVINSPNRKSRQPRVIGV
jgi:hypothetical protein